MFRLFCQAVLSFAGDANFRNVSTPSKMNGLSVLLVLPLPGRATTYRENEGSLYYTQFSFFPRSIHEIVRNRLWIYLMYSFY